MPQSLANILVHLVFSTKERYPFIQPSIESELHRYLAEMCNVCGSPSLSIDGTADHVHLLFSLGRTIAMSDVVEKVKGSSSGWIKGKGSEFRKFAWQRGYGAFSIGQSNVAALKHYIAGQKKHHARTTFQDEFRTLLRKYRIEYDEQYVWD